MELIKAIEEYKAAMLDHAARKTAYEQARTIFEMEHANEIQAYGISKARLESAETALRNASEEEYRITLNKNPAPGITIREVQTVSYEPSKAIEFCINHKFLNAFDLNKTTFKKIAIATRPDFVTISPKAEVRISRSL